MLQKLNSGFKTRQNLIFIGILSFCLIYTGSRGQAQASSIYHVSTKITQIRMDTTISAHSTPTHPAAHPFLHALANLFVHKPSSTISHLSSHSDSALSKQKNNFNAQSNVNIHSGTSALSTAGSSSVSTSNKPYHRWLSLLGHLVREMFTSAPTSFSPSVQTLAHAAGKTPVILVHGTWANGNILQDMYNSLDKAGIPTYVSTFGTGGNSLLGLLPRMGGVAPAAQAEKELADYIAQVQKETGAKKVDLVGHSQGGLLIKDYLAHDTEDNVQAVVDLGATNHGTTLSGTSKLLNLFPKPLKNLLVAGIGLIAGPGATDQLPDSKFIQDLNQYPDTKAGVHYLVLSTRDDLISTPYTNTYLKPVPGADVTNMEVHSIPGVTGFVGHNMYPIFPGIINKVKQYIEEKGEPGVPDFAFQVAAANPTVSANTSTVLSGTVSAITPPKVSLLG